MTTQLTTPIDNFSRQYHFLSNFSESEVWLDGVSYPSVEHAYQAAKTISLSERIHVKTAPTPNIAKRRGRRVTLRDNWEKIKDDIMYELIRQKFMQHPELSSKLLQTRGRELVEGNWWNDTYWGVCNGQGRNQLGKTLMRVREELFEKIRKLA